MRVQTKLFTGFMIIFVLMTLWAVWLVRRQRRGSREPSALVPRALWPLVLDAQYAGVQGARLGAADLVWAVTVLNTGRVLRNTARYGPLRPAAPVLVVLVHRDLDRLQYLVVSLAQVRRIHHALLVFSHTYYDARFTDLVARITFCRVMQIYFPNSAQLYPNTVPDTGRDKCPNRTEVHRDATLVERKHHWWWTAHQVFEENPLLRRHTGFRMFLLEDSYVLPDLLHMLNHSRVLLARFPRAKVLSFGATLEKNLRYEYVSVRQWPAYPNGLAFNRSTWEVIKAHSSSYCNFNDISWSKSALKALQAGGGGDAVCVSVEMPRVVRTLRYRVGREALPDMVALSESPALFPAAVQCELGEGRGVTPVAHGGWADCRDRALCMRPIIEVEPWDGEPLRTEPPTAPDLSLDTTVTTDTTHTPHTDTTPLSQ